MVPSAPVSRVNVLGIGVSAIDLPRAVDLILGAIAERRKGYVTVTGVHGVTEAQRNPALRAAFDGAFLVTPDGMPMVWMGRLQGFRGIARVYGPDLLVALCEATRSGAVRHYFYGGKPEVAEDLRRTLETRFPGVTIAGTESPPFSSPSEEELNGLSERLSESRAHIVWVGLGAPKQELFMAKNSASMPATIMIGVGAAFDIHSGHLRQAPRWMQRSGLEWFFRLIVEPRRLWRRYLINNTQFLWWVLLQWLGLRKKPLNTVDS